MDQNNTQVVSFWLLCTLLPKGWSTRPGEEVWRAISKIRYTL